MKIILLSGGSGKRLWPLSNDTRSKQFLKILDDNNGNKQSMVQRVWEQIKSNNLHDSTIIATSKLQREMIHSQIDEDVNVVTEPNRRDTYPAIALACSYLYTELNIPRDETIVVLPVDPYVENDFFSKLANLDEAIKSSESDLALIGVKPTEPSSKYGYILPKDKTSQSLFYDVESFIEKPETDEAINLIKQGSLWNCGVFAFKLDLILNHLDKSNLPRDYYALRDNYNELPQISFDYEIVEKANNIIVLTYEGKWKDLGTWNTLTEEMVTKVVGKGVISEDSSNTHLINELDIPVTIINSDNLIVAASPDGILISDKEKSTELKKYINNDSPPMYEERIWGWSKTIDYSKYAGTGIEMVTKRICIKEGKNSTFHFHKFRDEVWTIVKGEGELALDHSIVRIKAGDVVHIPSEKKHGVLAISDLEFIEVQTGSSILNEDIHRITHSWTEVIDHYKKSKSNIFS